MKFIPYVLASFNSTTTATINMRFHAKHFYSKVNRQVDLNPLTLIGLLEACLLSLVSKHYQHTKRACQVAKNTQDGPKDKMFSPHPSVQISQ